MTIEARFRERFGGAPDVVCSAAGRVNLMGDHTDYNGGAVLPTLLPRFTRIALARVSASTAEVTSVTETGAQTASISVEAPLRTSTWVDYVAGVVWALGRRKVTVPAFRALIETTLPVGAGLSSSAALTVAVGRALTEVLGVDLEAVEMARLCHQVEVDFVGVPVGIMDPFAVSVGAQGSALLLDTRTLEYRSLVLPSDAELLVIHSGVSHAHANGGYKTRRAECVRAAEALGIHFLAELDKTDTARISRLRSPLERRARHVMNENLRVQAAAKAIEQHDLVRLGGLFLESHRSLREDFEVSVPAVDAIVREASKHPDVYGARMTGGGFGGAVVALTRAGKAREAVEAILAATFEAGFPGAYAVVPDLDRVET